MGQPEIPKIEDLGDELALWLAYREVHWKRGIDIAKFYSIAATNIEKGLKPETRMEFRELCSAGAYPQGLAFILELLRNSPNLQSAWNELVGQPGNRETKIKALEKAANTVEFLFSDTLPFGSQAKLDVFLEQGRVPAPRVVSELRSYSRLIGLAESLSKDTETRSLVEFSKYVLTSYVKRMTGDFNDRCVSGLTAEVAGPKDYAETAHSQWRFRNYDRLDGHHSKLVKFLVAMSVVLASTA